LLTPICSFGAFATSFGLPLVCYLASFLCNDITGCPIPSVLHPSTITLAKLKQETGWPGIWGLAKWDVSAWVCGYYFLSLVLQAALPGVEGEGVALSDGGRLKYKFNGAFDFLNYPNPVLISPAFNSAALILSVCIAGTMLQGPDFPLWPFIWNNYTQIITVSLGIAFAAACFVYIHSFSVKKGDPDHRELAAGGISGNIIYDWFIGRELNPRITFPLIGTIDIKEFCELRPGLLGWVLMDLGFMAHQYKVYGFVSDSMILIVLFQTLYVLDALWMEPAILTTMDITTDGFGFMLAFGDLAWVPFIYSLQARYLAVYPVHLGITGILAVLAVQGFGYWIFRSSNNEKNRFRTNPNDPKIKHLKYMETASGSKLLISGWWGTARHINYLGDWIMAWSYCLPTGIAGYLIQYSSPVPSKDGQSPADHSFVGGLPVGAQVVQGEAKGYGMAVTYFYVIYFAILLIHREMRDEEKCKRKYGKDWDEYKKLVRWRILPGIY
jgi:delta14-sterol reductase